MCTVWVHGACGGQQRCQIPLELEAVVSWNVMLVIKPASFTSILTVEPWLPSSELKYSFSKIVNQNMKKETYFYCGSSNFITLSEKAKEISLL